MIIIGLFPAIFIAVLQKPVNLFTHPVVFNLNLIKVGAIDSLQIINWMFLGFFIIIVAIFSLRKFFSSKKRIETGTTWVCAYTPTGSKSQYTGSSYVRSFSKLAKPLLDIEKNDDAISEVFPSVKLHETVPYDKVERIFIDKPLKLLSRFANLFLFLQNGQLQRYILYGIIFITSVICLPIIIDKIVFLLHFLNNL